MVLYVSNSSVSVFHLPIYLSNQLFSKHYFFSFFRKTSAGTDSRKMFDSISKASIFMFECILFYKTLSDSDINVFKVS